MADATHRGHACLTKALMGPEDSLSLSPQIICSSMPNWVGRFEWGGETQNVPSFSQS